MQHGSLSDLRELHELLKDRPVAIELFAGVGGIGLGLEQAGFNVACAVEIEDVTGRYAAYNMPATRVLSGDVAGDVRRFNADVLSRVLPRAIEDEVAFVTGGPPCQGFSLAGKRRSDDPLNDLVLEFARVVSELKPKAFLMENVPGITIGEDNQLVEAMRTLGLGYRISDPTGLWASDFGVPQARKRIFLLGIRKDLGVDPVLPDPTHVRPSNGQGELSLSPTTPTVWDAIGDIPSVDEYPELVDGDRVPYTVGPTSLYAKVMRGFDDDPGSLAVPIAWDSTVCTNLRRTRHGDDLLARFESVGFGQVEPKSRIRRLDPDDVSTTIRAGTTSDRGSWSAPRPLHPFQNRVLTTRECARIQSFPDYFTFHPTKWHGNRQVGNAVPPLLARAIGNQVLSTLGLSVGKIDLPHVARDESIVADDVRRARESGLSSRKVSQYVASWTTSPE